MFPKSLIVFSLITVSNVLAIPKASWIRRQEDAQKSLTLDPAVISHGLEQDGQGDNPDPGQVRSLTSSNNFINFCLPFLEKGVPLTDGQQIVTGSCNPTPIGRIISLDLAPRCKFVFPKNGDESIVANQPFTVKLKLKNLQTGNFVNAQTNYYAAPQQVNGQGIVKGHSHVVIEELQSLKSAEPLDPTLFKFFKGLNDVAQDDILTADVTAGLPAGVYRICSINTAANHQPCLVSNAQHGSLDDCVYFTVKNPGEANNNDNKNNDNKNNETATAAANNTETSTAATETASDAAETGKNDNKDANETGKDDNKDANETGNASQTETGATETASETGKDANETGAPEASNTETADQGNETAPPENNEQASSTETAAEGNQTAAPENNEQGGKNEQGGDDQQDGKDQQQQEGSNNNEQPPANQDQAPVNQDQQQPPSQDQQQQPPAQDQQQQAPPTDQAPATDNQQQQGQGQQDQGGRGRNGQDGQQQPQGQDGRGNRDGGRGRNN